MTTVSLSLNFYTDDTKAPTVDASSEHVVAYKSEVMEYTKSMNRAY